jgi:hypothetical protein
MEIKNHREKRKMKYQNVEIIRSDRRKRTVQAKDIQGKLHIYLPSGMNEKEENK